MHNHKYVFFWEQDVFTMPVYCMERKYNASSMLIMLNYILRNYTNIMNHRWNTTEKQQHCIRWNKIICSNHIGKWYHVSRNTPLSVERLEITNMCSLQAYRLAQFPVFQEISFLHFHYSSPRNDRISCGGF